MDRLRPRNREVFSGFTNAEIEKMENFLKEPKGVSLGREFYQKLAGSFNRSTGRAGKPVIKWTEIEGWFQARLQDLPQVPNSELMIPRCMEEVMQDPSELEFEARSSKDGAWYDVEAFLAHRFLSTGEASRSDLLDLELRKMSGSILEVQFANALSHWKTQSVRI
ncbi:hypothetical protein PHAVU_009G111400 [Phaseolus vulgaris]|uniref:SAWADEE domain-containing protein n=1 Tax=Phaseolus vulgaris TaxID=3885 RepID=V7AYD3_PHAVU|nr:hypothetical protein PHAVU_009G111400g [Phaseolus vulgaris]ESW09236.1 hypothetical protein PHAVU_009G111400g [Phaseolus vulgaris]